MSESSLIPTHIISGFLGAGKTTLIHYWLQHKPAGERWAVIVNEFGQVGVDGALLDNIDAHNEVLIKDIPGGCLCCVGSQALQVGLNQLIRQYRPQRILIEPTGLGHPAKLIATLTGEYYHSVLDLKAVITLLDARNLGDTRYTENENFIDQIQMADILVASKCDTYNTQDKQALLDYANSLSPAKQALQMISEGALSLEYLQAPRQTERLARYPQAHEQAHQHTHPSGESGSADNHSADTQDCARGWLGFSGANAGFYSVGWIIPASQVFEFKALTQCIESIRQQTRVERIKGVMQTEQGWMTVNHTRQEQLTEACEPPGGDGHTQALLEIISREALLQGQLQLALKSCLQAERERAKSITDKPITDKVGHYG